MRISLWILCLGLGLLGCTIDRTTSPFSPSLDGRLAKVEKRLNGTQNRSDSPATRSNLEQRFTELYRGLNEINARMEELGRSQIESQRTLASVQSELGRLRERMDNLESGRLDPAGSSGTQASSLRGDLAAIQKRVEEAVAMAAQTKARLTDVERDLQQKIGFLDKEIRQIYRDIMNGLAAPAGAGGTHVVQSGETLGGIAERYGVTVKALLDANPEITDPSLIQVGQVINIP